VGEPAKLLQLAAAEKKKNADRIKKGKGRTFSAYKNDVVRQALQEMFNNKCAYCEAYIPHISPTEIEHFRPKSVYYWLAAEWSNLLLSCIHCNRPMKHFVSGAPNKVLSGKHTHFPIKNEKQNRCVSPKSKKKSLDERYRLLIDPCIDDPEEYFSYIQTGNAVGNIFLKDGLTPLKTERAQESIRLYGLCRMELVGRRAWITTQIFEKIVIIDREIESFNRSKQALRNIYAGHVREYIAQLVKFTEPPSEYRALAKQIVTPFLAKIKGEGW
jgi:uncharacterized protein (TIGR02646 family)